MIIYKHESAFYIDDGAYTQRERSKEMPDIVLTRIDNRLIHGQVATQWSGSIGANLILQQMMM